jgi:small conductance mechanosensitive channel
MVGRWVANLLLRVMERRDVDITLRQFIASAVRLTVLIMFGVIALNQLGISITPLIAAIGGLAVGLSLALQGPVSNYGAGLVIILTRMYRVGDTITTQGCSGLVEEISLAATHLRAEDGELIVIPNKHIVGEIHTNSEANRIVEGVIGIAYSADPTRAIAIIEGVLADTGNVDQNVPPEVGITNFGDSSIDIEYRYWTATGSYYNTVHVVNLAIFQAFGEQGIAIPFPQREVRLLND